MIRGVREREITCSARPWQSLEFLDQKANHPSLEEPEGGGKKRDVKLHKVNSEAPEKKGGFRGVSRMFSTWGEIRKPPSPQM